MHRSRPNSQHGTPQNRAAPVRPTRKVFNCILDDTALVAGVKRSTRNGIRQWVRHGQIRLFVPLHALEELSKQKNQQSRHGEDVRETLQWLDETTTKYPNVVTLQGADETYEKWAEVEQYVVPRTLFSEYDHELDTAVDELANEADDKLAVSDTDNKGYTSSGASIVSRSMSPSSLRSMRSSMSPVSPPTSPAKLPLSPKQNMSASTESARPQSSCGSVPQNMQSLFNYILWRIHQEVDPVAALESFIFLCNDPNKTVFAKGFDIKVKRLEQLREAIGREDREYKNRQAILNRESQDVEKPVEKSVSTEEKKDEVPLQPVPPKAPAAMLQMEKANVLDPNAFSRGTQPTPLLEKVQKSPRPSTAQLPRGSPRGGFSQPLVARGNGRPNGRGNFRGGPRGRGQAFTARGAFAPNDRSGAETVSPKGQIDPDSFARPGSRGSFNGARGGRRLWVPI